MLFSTAMMLCILFDILCPGRVFSSLPSSAVFVSTEGVGPYLTNYRTKSGCGGDSHMLPLFILLILHKVPISHGSFMWFIGSLGVFGIYSIGCEPQKLP